MTRLSSSADNRPSVIDHVHIDIHMRVNHVVPAPLPLRASEPHHPDGVWFLDYENGPNWIVVQYSPKHGWGVSYNPTEFGNEPDLVLDRKDVAERVAALLQATHKHYKGGTYRVLHDDVPHTETDEILTIYQHVWPHPLAVKARPKDNFHGTLEDGTRRFEPLIKQTA